MIVIKLPFGLVVIWHTPTGACTLSRFPPNKLEEFRKERGVQRPRNCGTQPTRRRVLSMGGEQNGESSCVGSFYNVAAP